MSGNEQLILHLCDSIKMKEVEIAEQYLDTVIINLNIYIFEKESKGFRTLSDQALTV